MPDFFAEEGDLDDFPPFSLDSFPSKGTVYEFSLEVMTSSDVLPRDHELSIFPNPGSDRLTLSYPSPSFTFTIRDAWGQVVHEGRASQNIQISSASWPAGVYFVSVGQEKRALSEMWLKYK
jgi:hypothetical protein